MVYIISLVLLFSILYVFLCTFKNEDFSLSDIPFIASIKKLFYDKFFICKQKIQSKINIEKQSKIISTLSNIKSNINNIKSNIKSSIESNKKRIKVLFIAIIALFFIIKIVETPIRNSIDAKVDSYLHAQVETPEDEVEYYLNKFKKDGFDSSTIAFKVDFLVPEANLGTFTGRLVAHLNPQQEKITYKIGKTYVEDNVLIEYEYLNNNEPVYYDNVTVIPVKIKHIDASLAVQKALEESGISFNAFYYRDNDSFAVSCRDHEEDKFFEILDKELENEDNLKYTTTNVVFYTTQNYDDTPLLVEKRMDNFGTVIMCNSADDLGNILISY